MLTSINNFIYSCFYCNNNKSDDWVTTDPLQPISPDGLSGYITPRSNQYDLAFKRRPDGSIVPQSEVGIYMYKTLCLGLKRHRLVYILEQLYALYLTLQLEIDDLNTTIEDGVILNEKLAKVSVSFMEYYSKFRLTLNEGKRKG